jgi:hypothetical protein
VQQLAKTWSEGTDQAPGREAYGKGHGPEQQLSLLRFSQVDQFLLVPTSYPLIVSSFKRTSLPQAGCP